MQSSFTHAGAAASRRRTGLVFALCIAGMLCPAALADERFVRELDAYCVAGDGTRTGVAASQDGATIAYVKRPESELQITRSLHNRGRVAAWHDMLDRAGFDILTSPETQMPYCAVQRTKGTLVHVVRWPENAAPDALADVFAAMLAAGRFAGPIVR